MNRREFISGALACGVTGRVATKDLPKAEPVGEIFPQRGCWERLTLDYIADLRREPLLKAILAGHLHIDVADRFSPTAMEYVVGGNFLFRGQEVLVT